MSDVAAFSKQMTFIKIGIETLAKGQITELHVGPKGIVTALNSEPMFSRMTHVTTSGDDWLFAGFTSLNSVAPMPTSHHGLVRDLIVNFSWTGPAAFRPFG